jgi:hypothetical protein
MALSVVAFESVWTTTTTPKSVVVTGCEIGDYLFCISTGDNATAVTEITTSTTVGSTSAWTEAQQNHATNCWYLGAWATVSAAGSITVQADAAGSAANWGMWVLRCTGSSGIGVSVGVPLGGSTQTTSLTVEAGSVLMFTSSDFSGGGVGSGWTPTADVTLVERSNPSGFTVHAAYWINHAAGTRAYGSTGAAGNEFNIVAMEIKEAPTGPPPSLMFLRPVQSPATLSR